MTRRNFLKFNSLIVFLILLFALTGKALALDVNVDASKTSAMPEVLKPRFFPWYFNDAQSYPIQKITNDGLAKYIYGVNATVSWNVYFNQGTDSLDDTINKMKQYWSDLKLNLWFSNNHINFVIGIASMPKWLSADPTNNGPIISGSTDNIGLTPIWHQSPPKCYDFECNGQKGWASLVKEVVHYFNAELGLNAPLNVWHEPSWNYFYGTEQEYFQLYKYAVIGAKAADPNIKIAGPAPVTLACKVKTTPEPDGQYYCENTNNHSMMQDFIEYAGTHRLDYDNDTENVHLHYDKWPIDIISFSGLDQYGNSWKNIAEQTRGWLASKGYSANTPMFAQEFGTWIFNGKDFLDPNRDKEYIASYAINQLGWLDRAGINYYYFTTLFDFHGYGNYPQIATQEFIGTNDPWTSNYVIKSVYNAFKALSILDGKQEGEISNRIQATFNDNDFVTAVGAQTKDKSKTRLLFSNFIPTFNDTSQATQFIIGVYRTCLLSKGYTLNNANSIWAVLTAYNQSHHPSECSSGIWTSSCLSALISGAYGSTQTAVDLLECTNNSSTGVLKKLNDLNTYKTAARQVDFAISGLPFSGAATLTTYTIDKDNSNSCKVNKKTEAAPTNTECGVNGIIDQKVNQAKTDSVNAAADYLLSLGYSQSQVNAFANCALTPGCYIQDLVNNYCTSNPSLCDKLKADIAEATKLRAGLFNYGTYTATTGKKYSITTYIDKINSDPALLKSYTDITVPLEGSKKETGINIINGVYSGTITMQPYSVILLEISGTPDTQPPSPPINLTATAVSSTQINLSWTASTDNVGVTGYRIERCQGASCTNLSFLVNSTQTNYSNTGLTPNTTYRYQVKAYDAAGNASAQSNQALATTQTQTSQDTTPPQITNVSVSNITTNSATITWVTNENSDSQVECGLTSSYYGSQTSLAANLVTSHSASLSGLSAATLYHYRVKSKDQAGNLATSADYTFTTKASVGSDTTSPTVPTNLSATAVSSSQINLSWTASTDNVGVTGYRIYRNVTQVGTAITTSYSDRGLAANTTYTYKIFAYDAAGNASAQSNLVSATTQTTSSTTPTTYANGTILKTTTSPDLYVIKDGKRELIPNWQSFLSFGYQLANLKIISLQEMLRYAAIDLTKIDSDKDGLTNAQERQYGTDAAKADTDGDGYNDYLEISKGYSPLIPANIKSGAVFAYSKPRLSSLADEQERARILRSELEKKYTKEQLKGISAKNWFTVVNSYIYGGYPIEAIVKALKFSGKTVHPTIPWSVWQKSKDYSDYINK